MQQQQRLQDDITEGGWRRRHPGVTETVTSFLGRVWTGMVTPGHKLGKGHKSTVDRVTAPPASS